MLSDFLGLKSVIRDTSAADWPGASRQIPFIFAVKTENITENCVFSSELIQPSDKHQRAPLVFLLSKRCGK